MKDIKSVIVMVFMFIAQVALMAMPALLAVLFRNPAMTMWWAVLVPFIWSMSKMVIRRVYPNEALTNIEQEEAHFVVSVVDTHHLNRSGQVVFDI